MVSREPSAQDAIRAALEPTGECPTLEELESLASGEALAARNLTGHLQTCAYCQTELHLLKTFLAGEAGRATQDASRTAELLRRRRKEILRQAFRVPEPESWWKAVFAIRRMAQASLAAAAILLIVGTVVFFRSSTHQAQLEAKNPTGQEVLRSGSFAVLGPAGDLQERPKEIRWEQVPKATVYEVRLLEVDRSELWKANTAGDRIDLPATIQDQIVPSKTLFAEIAAFDSSGNKVGTTGLVRFRLVQNHK